MCGRRRNSIPWLLRGWIFNRRTSATSFTFMGEEEVKALKRELNKKSKDGSKEESRDPDNYDKDERRFWVRFRALRLKISVPSLVTLFSKPNPTNLK